MILGIKEQQRLLDGEPTLQRSIRLRNPYVDSMSLLQVELLKRWRAADRDRGENDRRAGQHAERRFSDCLE